MSTVNSVLWRKRQSWRWFLAPTALILLGSMVTSAGAQQIYRNVAPDGRITFSDRPSSPDTETLDVRTRKNPSGTTATDLPFELRQLVAKTPVTLYTTANCGPCDKGRMLLGKRGVPFIEKSVVSNDDINAFITINKDNTLPLLTLGNKQIQGYSESEWTQALDAANYPKQSILPATYTPPPASALAPPKPTSGTEGAKQTSTTSDPAAPTGAEVPRKRVVPVAPKLLERTNNPAGISF